VPTGNVSKRVLDQDPNDIFDDTPMKKLRKNRPTAAGLPYQKRLVADAGKRNLRVYMVTAKAWLSGQLLDARLSKAWLDAFNSVQDELGLDPDMEPEDEDIAVVRCLLTYLCYGCSLTSSRRSNRWSQVIVAKLKCWHAKW
jgi:hypothetical protein